MPTTIPLMSIAAPVAERRARTSSRMRSAGNRTALWFILAIVGATIAAGVLLPAPPDSAATEGTTWVVGP